MSSPAGRRARRAGRAPRIRRRAPAAPRDRRGPPPRPRERRRGATPRRALARMARAPARPGAGRSGRPSSARWPGSKPRSGLRGEEATVLDARRRFRGAPSPGGPARVPRIGPPALREPPAPAPALSARREEIRALLDLAADGRGSSSPQGRRGAGALAGAGHRRRRSRGGGRAPSEVQHFGPLERVQAGGAAPAR